jgi:hypothetical protein
MQRLARRTKCRIKQSKIYNIRRVGHKSQIPSRPHISVDASADRTFATGRLEPPAFAHSCAHSQWPRGCRAKFLQCSWPHGSHGIRPSKLIDYPHGRFVFSGIASPYGISLMEIAGVFGDPTLG